MNIYLCREVFTFWFVDCSFQSDKGLEPRKKNSDSILYLCVQIKKIPLNAFSAYLAKTHVMIRKKNLGNQYLKIAKYTKPATRSVWSLSSQDLASWETGTGVRFSTDGGLGFYQWPWQQQFEKKFLRKQQQSPPPFTDLGCKSPSLRKKL